MVFPGHGRRAKFPRGESETITNTSGSVWQGEEKDMGPPETSPGGVACCAGTTEAAGMKPLPQTQATATHTAMKITQAQGSEA